ncbi:MAG TPA: hypothetical protein VGN16_12905 [Acidobacteriaceae bacterium]|jgi:hypothetical protein
MTGETYVGSVADDIEILRRLPFDLAAQLAIRNGYVALRGGLHVRGACLAPEWHSLRYAWEGPHALHLLFPEVRPSDIPIAEDCFGDQFLIRDGEVIQLAGETGDIKPLGLNWEQFLLRVQEDAVEFLALRSFERYLEQGGSLEPEQSLSVYPPFVAAEDNARTFRPVGRVGRISFLADFAEQIRTVPDGQRVGIVVK